MGATTPCAPWCRLWRAAAIEASELCREPIEFSGSTALRSSLVKSMSGSRMVIRLWSKPRSDSGDPLGEEADCLGLCMQLEQLPGMLADGCRIRTLHVQAGWRLDCNLAMHKVLPSCRYFRTLVWSGQALPKRLPPRLHTLVFSATVLSQEGVHQSLAILSALSSLQQLELWLPGRFSLPACLAQCLPPGLQNLRVHICGCGAAEARGSDDAVSPDLQAFRQAAECAAPPLVMRVMQCAHQGLATDDDPSMAVLHAWPGAMRAWRRAHGGWPDLLDM